MRAIIVSNEKRPSSVSKADGDRLAPIGIAEVSWWGARHDLAQDAGRAFDGESHRDRASSGGGGVCHADLPVYELPAYDFARERANVRPDALSWAIVYESGNVEASVDTSKDGYQMLAKNIAIARLALNGCGDLVAYKDGYEIGLVPVVSGYDYLDTPAELAWNTDATCMRAGEMYPPPPVGATVADVLPFRRPTELLPKWSDG